MHVNMLRQFAQDSKTDHEKPTDKQCPLDFQSVVGRLKREGEIESREQGIQELKLVNRNDMTLEEYKEYIYQEISNIFIHSSQGQTQIYVSISEEAWNKMKEDQSYEYQILGLLKRDFGSSYPIGYAPAYRFFYIGKEYSEYRVDEFYVPQDLHQRRKEDRFWDRKEAKKRKQKKEQDKKHQKLLQQRAYINKLAIDKQLARNAKQQAINEAISRERAGFLVNSVEVAMASKAYETHFNSKDLMKVITGK